MNRPLLARIDDDLDSREVAELCFLCSDVINRKQLEEIKCARDLFVKLEEKGFLNSTFLAELFRTTRRADLLNMLESDSREREETDACPAYLSEYRLMLYKIHEDLTDDKVETLKFLVNDQIAKRQLDKSSTALNVFAEMEKAGLISKDNVDKLHELMINTDNVPLAKTVKGYKDRLPPTGPGGGVNNHSAQQETMPSEDIDEFYSLTQNPRGCCVIISNEDFTGSKYRKRLGSKMDDENLSNLFKRFGFVPIIHTNLTADKITEMLKELSKRDFSKEDALVVCVLSHGERGIIIGTDGKEVKLDNLFDLFKNVPSLFGKPKLFFIQACQDEVPLTATQKTNEDEQSKETPSDSVFSDASCPSKDGDILIGMATVPYSKAYRHTEKGSIYIQVLCQELENAANSPKRDDILTVLTRVNRKVNNHFMIRNKQMPEPKYTLTKRLVLRFVELSGTVPTY
ncbi:caspase-8 [Poecilia latipinna]|uniref:caspase-8 n=1 Tax=Poecilia latipinna TaxID=48699 RepID=UPI00072E9BE3|nr:PREDICTED: caspase-8-like [Poecilia latipinna]XP_014905926.1 PREDICTED: caspase-8-like [Poecilia latipinna]XP_014905927.1 PREDICTED: caspase-8-like [Poecilia latipinna]XP_014905928.1 PREDICTED: caspase-8-like [Poecilia latipinna]XP_014905929.1 PREDICTED: caspase-8-like [Poecilia latipinna]XP_014905930.1 PREDICTED: caspase-8-like [Poecilia latipinna]XP_014905931.1 PREDICTED: caspase-8-like [Poecilia latipinna]XP_014905933.1 PREDICTED: caspase-8-like [Poecilia latipinna]